jgi:DNA polymerase
MNLLTIDFETYYDKDFSLSKITTEEYIRDSRFEVIGVAVKVNDQQTQWASGPKELLKDWLTQFDIPNSVVLAHNMMFDGSILSWHFDLVPRFMLDTLCMGRALHGVEVGASLSALVQRYGLGEKGTEVINALGKRREDFDAHALSRYGDYCINDVDLTHKLYLEMVKGFPKKELHLIDMTLRMFTIPVLELDTELLDAHLIDVVERKRKLLENAGVTRDELMSNQKFGELLHNFGVEPPTKISPTTGKKTLAMAKSDEEFKALAEHPDERVQILVAARLGNKSTLEETRTERLIGIATRGKMPVPIRYYAAHTGRFGGDDKINLQNLPSRGANANKLKLAIMAPKGYRVIDADSAQIEARVLAWLAEQDDLVMAFANREDVYKKMASIIYNKRMDYVTPPERFIGKTTILGAGYGMGAVKFQAALKQAGVVVNLDEARRIIDAYRYGSAQIVNLWRQAKGVIECLSRKDDSTLGRAGVLTVEPNESAIRLPSGLLMRYDDLQSTDGEQGPEFTYKTRRGRTRIYGGKVIENVCQAIARCIIGEQMLRIGQKYRVVLTVHDAIACVVREEQVEEAQAYVEECMRWTPKWAVGLPVNCESGVGQRYGEC